MKPLIKTIMTVLLLILIKGNLKAIDTESYQFIDHLLKLGGPQGPELFEDGIIFTVPSSYKRVGIAFSYEGFSKVYWFKKLVFPEDTVQKPKNKKIPDYQDSGILFYVYTLPKDIRDLEYRLIIDGLWTIDPANPLYRIDASGLGRSIVSIPAIKKIPSTFDDPPGSLSFSYIAPAGEVITVGGNFNGWDPFMYELQERTPGNYSLTLSLPPGTYHYVFFYRGRRILDPHNPHRIYTKEGKAVSLAVIQ